MFANGKLPISPAVALFAILAFSLAAQAPGSGQTLSLTSVDPNCGQGSNNCRAAFQKAFAALAQSHGGTLEIPPGTYVIDLPDVPNNVPSAPPPNRNSLILVPPKVLVRGHVRPDGTPDSIIESSISSVPLFIFANASESAMQNLHFRFIGTTPTNFPYGDIILLRSLGFNPTFPHYNQMAGGQYEMFSTIYTFGSSHCKFDNLVFDSKNQDNDHVIGLGINVKGAGLLTQGGAGGLEKLAEGNEVSRIHMFDYVMGIMISGQQDLKVHDIVADRRGSTKHLAPGHLIYVAPMLKYPAGGKLELIQNRNLQINNVKEGAHTYSNIISGGTIALKYVNGGSITQVISEHPLGILQTMVSDQNVTFENLKWESSYDACKDSPGDCNISVINSSLDNKDLTQIPMENLTFENVSLKSATEPISVTIIGSNIKIDNMTIETPPWLKEGQGNPYGVLSLKLATHVTITNYKYIPVITSAADLNKKANAPFACWNPCRDVKGDVNVKWPAQVPTPAKDHQIVKSVFQDQEKDPTKQIAVTSKITPKDQP